VGLPHIQGGIVHPYLVVPTHTHPPLLDTLIDRAGMPAVVVLTREGVDPVAGAVNVEDVGPTNIHRWWNTGIAEAEARGADVAVIANHDAEPEPGALMALVEGLERTGATITYTAREDGPVDRAPDKRRRITGWCYALNLTHGLRPDETFRWWFGDDWLDWQARVNHHGIAPVRAAVRHRNPNPQYLTPEFAALVRADQKHWWQVKA
jgi:hypothetical protein